MNREKQYKNIIYCFGVFLSLSVFAQLYTAEEVSYTKKADLIIFSFDRPLQLYALLESLDCYVSGVETASVIYRASDDEFSRAYDEVALGYSGVHFIKQGKKPREDFKPLTQQVFEASPAEYIIFGVDDIIVKDFVNLSECIALLDQAKAYGFYLRLGKNITEHYISGKKFKIPSCRHVGSDAYLFRFNEVGLGYWRYPNTVDMTLYCKKDIVHEFKTIAYHSPNALEGRWAARAGKVKGKGGLFYSSSKVVNFPLNRVQSDYSNKHMNIMPAKDLLDRFNAGFKMNIDVLFQINNKSAHMAYTPEFVQR